MGIADGGRAMKTYLGVPARMTAVLGLATLLLSTGASAATLTPTSLVAPGGFVAAQGAAGRAQWVARGLDCNAYFEPHAVTLDRPFAEDGRGVAVRVSFPAGHGRESLQGEGAGEARVSAFLGNDPAAWQGGVPVAREIRYQAVAPGVDLVYRMHDGRLKYDLVLAPGARLDDARLRYDGARGLDVDAAGGLKISTDAGVLYEQPPVLYQDTPQGRVSVRGGYRVRSHTDVGYWAGDYDHALPLIVDPGLAWSTFLGGDNVDNLYGVTTDRSGNVYVVGSTSSTNFPTSTGAYQRANVAPTDVVVSKLSSDGTTLMWSTLLGGSGNDIGYGIAVDGSGNVVVTGATVSINFPVTSGVLQTALKTASFYDAFVTKISSDGSRLLWSTYLGGSGHDNARAVAIDGSGNVVVAGYTGSTNFPTTTGVIRPTRSPALFDGADGFIAKIASNGASVMWATYLGSNTSTDDIFAMTLDAAGEPTVTGWTSSSDFPTTTGAFSRTFKGYSDCFVTRLNSTASGYVFSTLLGGATGYDEGHAITTDANGNTYVAGYTNSNDFPVTAGVVGPTYVGPGGYYDVFVTKLAPNGGSLGFSTYLGGNGHDQAYGIGLAPGGQVVVTGTTASTNFPVTSNGFQRSNSGGTDGFAVALSPSGGSEVYGTYLGSSGTDQPQAVAVRGDGRVVTVGNTDGGTFPATGTSLDGSLNSASMADGFVTVFDMGLSGASAAPEVPVVLELERPQPNPFVSSATISFSLREPGSVRTQVVDAAGRLVRDDGELSLGLGRHTWSWNGTDASGRPVAAGLYFVHMTAGGQTMEQAMVRLR